MSKIMQSILDEWDDINEMNEELGILLNGNE